MKKQSTYARSLVIMLCLMLGVGTAQVAFANEDPEFISEDSVVTTEAIDQEQEESTEVDDKEIDETVEEEAILTETVEPSTDAVEEETKEEAKKVKAVKYNLGAIKNKTELEAAFAGALEGDVITLASDFVAEDVSITVPNANITFDANHVIWTNSTLEVTVAHNVTLNIKNLVMDGVGHTSNLLRISNPTGVINLSNSKFINNGATPITANIQSGAEFTIDTTLINNNKGVTGGSAVQLSENSRGTFNVTNSTISNNTGTSGGYTRSHRW
ncbi:hypothetical protein [Erysipelothrix piscisicarius]|uniref:hypothetical protein n=1 Tax=Erysipelothrix piscisicarius TaxID=2485784 RepID=UPI001E29CC65|nr:hypothetical protein [Erysipelothrix piscisicarius]